MSGTYTPPRVPQLGDLAALEAAMLAYLDNRPADGETAALLPVFIGLAEELMAEGLRVRAMVTRAALDLDDRYVTLPCDCLELIDVRWPGEWGMLQQRREDSAARYAGAGARGPLGYAIIGDQLEITPDQTPHGIPPGVPRQIELAYYARPTPLRDPTDSNAILREHPGVYLFGALMQTAPVLREDDRLQVWGGLYSALRDSANAGWLRAKYSGSRLNARIRAA